MAVSGIEVEALYRLGHGDRGCEDKDEDEDDDDDETREAVSSERPWRMEKGLGESEGRPWESSGEGRSVESQKPWDQQPTRLPDIA